MSMKDRHLFSDDFAVIIKTYWNEFKKLRGSTVVITGATGMLGEYTIHLLMELNHAENAGIKVVGVVRSAETAHKKYENYEKYGWYKSIECDVRDLKEIDGPVDIILHAASPTSPYAYEHFPADVATTNMLGTMCVLELAREKKAKVLFVSSSSIYGAANGIEITENFYGSLNPLEVRSCYSEGKRAAETLCAAYYYQYGVDAKIVRCRRVYGPTVNLKEKSLLNKLLQATAENSSLDMFRSPENMIQLLYIGDAVTGILKVLLSGNPAEAYNICSEDPIRVDDLAELLSRLTPEYHLSVRWREKDQLDDPVRTKTQKSRNNARCSNQKLRNLGWKSLFSLQYGLLKTIEGIQRSNECDI